MRETAKYSFRSDYSDSASARSALSAVKQCIGNWLSEKGASGTSDDIDHFQLHDGRVAHLEISTLTIDQGELISWTLQEPTDDSPNSSIFRTSLSVCKNDTSIAVACSLEVGNPFNIVAPITFDSFCPRVIRDIIDLNHGWAVAQTPITTRPIFFKDPSEAVQFWEIVSDRTRSLPIVTISDQDGRCLHPQIAPRMARELAGLAIIARVSSQVAWEVTNTYGPEWSCYNGAIRIYWPFRQAEENPYLHPVWTTSRLLQYTFSAEEASKRIRTQIRRRIFGLSALTISEDGMFSDIRTRFRNKQHEQKRQEVSTNEEWIKLLGEENESLAKENRGLQDQISRLHSDLANAKLLYSWNSERKDEVEPVTEDLVSATDAVRKAMRIFTDELIFGDDALKGAEEINHNKVSPNKIYAYLEGLSRLAKAKQSGTLGKTEVMWLNENGFSTSTESETIKSSADEMKKRTWGDGNARRPFELHMKPTDVTHPDGCVRIYFLWDKELHKVVVGWVGRHPE